jgi:predicted RNase H-like HicB family nuclease
MHKYQVTIFWSDQDKVFVAEAPELAGCMAHGATQAEAVKNLEDAVDLWIETAKEFGDEIPEPMQHSLAA